MPADVFDTGKCDLGQFVEMRDGTVLQVTENPRDGVWMFGRPRQADGTLGAETTIYVDDVVGIAG